MRSWVHRRHTRISTKLAKSSHHDLVRGSSRIHSNLLGHSCDRPPLAPSEKPHLGSGRSTTFFPPSRLQKRVGLKSDCRNLTLHVHVITHSDPASPARGCKIMKTVQNKTHPKDQGPRQGQSATPCTDQQDCWGLKVYPFLTWTCGPVFHCPDKRRQDEEVHRSDLDHFFNAAAGPCTCRCGVQDVLRRDRCRARRRGTLRGCCNRTQLPAESSRRALDDADEEVAYTNLRTSQGTSSWWSSAGKSGIDHPVFVQNIETGGR